MKQRNYTAELKKAQGHGAKIVCSAAPYVDHAVVYSPRKKRDPAPWILEGKEERDDALFRYSGRECHAVYPDGVAPKKKVSLTTDQKFILETLHSKGGLWSPGCGWIWQNRSTTVRHMDALARKGLVERTRAEKYREEYRITDAGIEAAPTFAEKIQMILDNKS